MQENETAPEETSASASAESSSGEQTAPAAAAPAEDISYQAVYKDGEVSAIWEMQGRKHLRTIDPRSRQGQDILRLYTTDHQDETATGEATETAATGESS